MTDPFAGAEPTLPPYAGWWRRVAAILIDGLLLALPFFASIVIAIAVTEGAADPESEDDNPIWLVVVISWLFWIVAPFVYYTILHGRPRGQTLGKRLLGIRVTGVDFQPIGYGRAFGRALLASLLWIACYLPGILDALWPLWDEKKQSLHDKVVNSIVVRA